MGLALNRRALESKERTHGPNSPLVAATLNNMANVLHRLGDYEGATPLLERALGIKERAHG